MSERLPSVHVIQVAEELLNPFGEDDDSFEINTLIDSMLKVRAASVSLCVRLYVTSLVRLSE